VHHDVRYEATQRAGIRGVSFELALFVLYLLAAPLVVRGAGDLRLWLVVAVGGVLLRVAVFSGPHRRGVEVTDRAVRFGRSALALADIERVETVDRSALKQRRDELEMEHVPPGPREGVILHLRTPEGTTYAIGLAVDDAAALADRIEDARPGAVRPTDGMAMHPLPVRRRQGVDRRWAAIPVAVGVLFDVLSVTVGDGVVVGASVLGIALVAWTASRPVRIDDTEVGTRGLQLRWDEVTSARLVTFGEQLQLPKGRSRAPIWGPPYALVVLVDGPTGASPTSRTVVIGVPVPIDLGDHGRGC
jgi:hypothetical protein